MSAGKGDKRRPGSLRAYEEGHERIWGRYVSICCHAVMRVEISGVTNWHVCEKCGLACDGVRSGLMKDAPTL